MLYKSTRSNAEPLTASMAILKGLAEDGGLYVPELIPRLPEGIEAFTGKSYKETAYQVMKQFLTDYTEAELRECIDKAYDEKFDDPKIASLRHAGDAWYLELFHGKTIAFKDMALSILPYLMTTAARKNQVTNEIVILTATSGDTGKAALAGFADVPGTRIIVFYPKHGVSAIQEKQMVTQQGENTCVIGIEGNFDDAQNGVKAIFSDEQLRARLAAAGYQFSSANSINIGRLVPQIVYYVYAYAQLASEGAISQGERINVTVPTGNFGNILAAWYAKQMGVPIDRLICASNENKVLFDFFETGEYNRNRPFVVTSSPSIDILTSSNLERMIYYAAGEDPERTLELMQSLKEQGSYRVSEEMRSRLGDFIGGSAGQTETAQEIARVLRESKYILDPHTAVASRVYREYRERTGDTKETVIASTASPFKFNRSVMEAIERAGDSEDDFALADRLSELSGIPLPEAVEEIRTAPVRHTMVVRPEQMKAAVEQILGIA